MTQTTPAASLQRLCPRCSTLAYTSQRRCPFCGGRYRRLPLLGTVAVLVVFTLLLLGGLTLVGLAVADRLEREVDTRVRRTFDQEARQVERRIVEELDRRLPTGGLPQVPTTP